MAKFITLSNLSTFKTKCDETYVPYTGATKDVNLGSHTLILGGTIKNQYDSTNVATLTLPTSTGTLALTSQLPSLTNYVTTNTAQTVSGNKIFTGTFQVQNDITVGNTNVPKNIILNSSTSNGYSTTLKPGTTTSNITITLPNSTGTLATTEDISKAISNVYTIQGSSTVALLNQATKDSSMNGYVFNISDSGNLTNKDSSKMEVLAGDNVVFIWSSGSWYWDKLSNVSVEGATTAEINALFA